jgi:hypothetical protein
MAAHDHVRRRAAEQFSDQQMQQMAEIASERSSTIPKRSCSLSRQRLTSLHSGQPIISALRMRVPETSIRISALSLVIQDGSERCWNWSTNGIVRSAPLQESDTGR